VEAVLGVMKDALGVPELTVPGDVDLEADEGINMAGDQGVGSGRHGGGLGVPDAPAGRPAGFAIVSAPVPV
jgi:hypothetical protein